MNAARHHDLMLRGLRMHCSLWGDADAPLLLMLHGWGDAGASFQFVVDQLGQDWHVVAPDWRGFGRSEWASGGYWFPDYLGDLDALAAVLSPEAPLRLVGHSMGGNIACLYAGIRPGRVSRVVAIDAFGLADRPADEAPGRYEKWLGTLAQTPPWRRYDSFEALADRLRHRNPRLDGAKAAFLAEVLGRTCEDGRVTLSADPAHQRVNPVLYRRAEAEACWRRAQAPVMWIEPEDETLRRELGVDAAQIASAKACFSDFREHSIANAGHNLHHDVPNQIAALIEDFMRETRQETPR
ncbi:alpha/beta fold hydrolase [Denitromonas iodatirespirans]|uniref:Alpha/beta fold hydrolase n=1 Tax=Denitromonas iodatirespirans TaxID=2795389 RepID=A0A944D643_DENI1|nr:alpha/beta fold hydrolase [Denitromonas iodatirespirans]MBT0960675.1 alpha/beta fold hydrolase [Denitromonas iodatirespirans]